MTFARQQNSQFIEAAMVSTVIIFLIFLPTYIPKNHFVFLSVPLSSLFFYPSFFSVHFLPSFFPSVLRNIPTMWIHIYFYLIQVKVQNFCYLGNTGLSLLLCFPVHSVICLGLSMSLIREKCLYFLVKHLWC